MAEGTGFAALMGDTLGLGDWNLLSAPNVFHGAGMDSSALPQRGALASLQVIIENHQFNSLFQSWRCSVTKERGPDSCGRDVLLPQSLGFVCSPRGDQVALHSLGQGIQSSGREMGLMTALSQHLRL